MLSYDPGEPAPVDPEQFREARRLVSFKFT